MHYINLRYLLTYFGTENLFKHLQLVQNAAARLIVQAGWHEHITPVLQQLH